MSVLATALQCGPEFGKMSGVESRALS
jgi:hypothetical protein